ncbi:MAG: glutamate decarboxylase, partial [Solirubrobacteraceae bacterium]|nr:glutamate decarboxylase [Solirubrobacteraceae bacterium]
CLDKNLVDKDEYPQSAELERRCVSILADLWHAPEANHATGTSTTGSSEACMLGGMALLRRWRARRPDGGRPNLVMGANVQVCWEKFCRYWDVEARQVPVGGGTTHLVGDRAAAACDENTIGVVAILGSTFDGSYEPVADIAAALDGLQADRGIDVPIHVDAASGGFIAPFLEPGLEWDFRVARVQSINVSGHKYGLVFPGLGWVVWRDRAALPEDLVFDVDYLGGHMPTFGLSFSRPAAQVIAQYYTLIRLGREGFRRVQQDCRDVAMWLAAEIGAVDGFALLSQGDELPVFAFRAAEADGDWSVYDVSERLRAHGWIVPAYPMPAGMEDVHVLRVVVRNGFSRDLAGLLVRDLRAVMKALREGSGKRLTAGPRTGFHH